MIRRLASSLRLRGFARDRRGVSAVEFALMAPLMLTLYFGTVEISQGISVKRKLSLTARAVADLAAQTTNITNADMTNLLNASAAVVSPFPSDKLSVIVSLVTIDANSKATITWSDAYNDTARAKGSAVTLPAGLLVPSTALVWSEVKYAYKPTVGYMVTGTVSMSDKLYMRPRLSDSITRTAS
ncbi:MAG: TadE/TadG family type IV pilus assembly protein [Pseudorhodoplanes sp.]